MEAQSQNKQKPNSDQVVIFMDDPNSKLKDPTDPQLDTISESPAKPKTLHRLNFSKPRARFAETTYPLTPKTILESEENKPLYPHDDTSSTDSDDEWFENEDEDEEEDGNGGDSKNSKYRRRRKRKINKRALIEFILFVIIMICLICSLTLKSLKHTLKWGLEIWKWCLMIMARRRRQENIPWPPTFFDRMKESVFHHYILDALSGPPLDESERELRPKRGLGHSKTMPARLREGGGMVRTLSKKGSSRKIDIEKLKKLSMGSRASAWSVKRLVNYVKGSGLSTISRSVDDFGNGESEINSEWEARTCAQRIFKNVAKHGAK
ncbi:hypothetical protein CCACVL1_03624 [Corchorus capsularis]|uniref:Uncharacterized protein n=1 Tax=Corchorus capsularis TaxID=210143 RepID=A0A1R3JYB8_COCAP|nr:hypothetical protein CCACVL1_03624 [Corchorus capsularis]